MWFPRPWRSWLRSIIFSVRSISKVINRKQKWHIALHVLHVFIRIQNAAAAAAALCFAIRVLLLCCCGAAAAAAAVRHRVRDGKLCCWFIESDSSVFFLFFQIRFVFRVPLTSTSTLSHFWPRFAYILGNYGPVRSQRGGQPAVAKPSLYIRWYCVTHTEYLVYTRHVRE